MSTESSGGSGGGGTPLCEVVPLFLVAIPIQHIPQTFRATQLTELLRTIGPQALAVRSWITLAEEYVYGHAMGDRLPFVTYRMDIQRLRYFASGIERRKVYRKYTARQWCQLSEDDMLAAAGMHPEHVESAHHKEHSREIMDRAASMNIGERWMQCKKCGSYNIKFQQVQVMRADEGMTTFCVCMNERCGARWKDQ